MIRIVSLDIVDLLSFPSGVLFALKEKTERSGEKIAFYSYDVATNSIGAVTRSAYLLTKFGASYMNVAEKLKDHITCDTAKLANGQLFLVYPSGETGWFDENGKLISSGDVHYRGCAARTAAADPDGKHLWSVVPEQDLIVKYTPAENRIVMRIGGDGSASFRSPCSVSVYEDALFICNPGANKVNRVSLTDFSLKDHRQFDETVYRYLVSAGREFVALRTGVYML